MPITAKLSRQFYEKLGDEVTNELVTWLNAVDDSYRQEFKDLFAANFSPLRAEIEAKLGQVRAEMAQLRTEVETRMGHLRGEMTQLRGEIDVKLAQLEGRLRVEISESKASLIRWMLGFWVAQVAVTISAIVAVRQLLH